MKLPVPGDNRERSWARGCPARWSCSSLASTDVGLPFSPVMPSAPMA